MSDVADTLRKARALLQERGWGQRGYEPNGRSLCMMGAVNVVVNGNPYDTGNERVIAPIRDLLIRGADCKMAYIAWWNDAPERTQAEVLAAFDKAIELAEASQ